MIAWVKATTSGLAPLFLTTMILDLTPYKPVMRKPEKVAWPSRTSLRFRPIREEVEFVALYDALQVAGKISQSVVHDRPPGEDSTRPQNPALRVTKKCESAAIAS